MNLGKMIAGLFLISLLGGCNSDDDPVQEPKVLAYDFQSDTEGWSGDFADYPQGEETFYELEWGYAQLPDPLDQSLGAIRQSGNNHSDDLFMFLKKKLTGLQPSTSYDAYFTLEIATNVPDEAVGVGGSPGNSVYIKAGAAAVEPDKVLEGNDYLMNIDKGNQSQGGENMQVLGDFANGTDQWIYRLKTLKNTTALKVTTNAEGELWLVVGTDSGFEATTTIFYNSISVRLE